MNRFFIALAMFVTILLSLLYGMDEIVTLGLKKGRLGTIERGGVNADILIVGSSRAYRHFDTPFLSTELHQKVCNLGFDASAFETQKVLLDFYLQRNPAPNTVIWEVNYTTFNEEDQVYNYPELIPFLRNDLIDQYLIQEKGVVNPAMKYFPMVRYYGLSGMIFRGIRRIVKKDSEVEADYKIVDRPWNASDFKKMYLNGSYRITMNLSKNSVNDFVNEVTALQAKGTRVIMVFTPIFSGINAKKDDKEKVIKFYQSLSRERGIAYFDYSSHALSSDTLNFYNVLHMNKTGVRKFNEVLLNDMR